MTRHICRIVVLLAIASLVLVNDYFSIKGQYGGQKIIDASPIYSKAEQWFGSSPHLRPHDVAVQGSLWSMRVLEFRISDPLAVPSAPDVLWWSAILPIVIALLLGRVFCGWLCPMGILSDFVAGIRRVARRFGVQFFSLGVSAKLKYVVLAVGLIFSVVLSVSFFYTIYPPRILSDLVRDLLVGSVQMYGVYLIGGVLLIELLFVERLWCRCLCPGGAVYSLLGMARLLRIRRAVAACTDCGDCDRVCPHQLKPATEELGGECDNCGLCKRACQPDALSYTLGPPRRGKGMI